MRQRLNLRLKALEKWLPDETKPHKALLPEWLMEDLRQQGIRFDASGLPEKISLEEKLKTLPKDYVGERHVVIVKREPSGAPGNEWCEFEERPGPAPVDAQEEDCTTIYIIYREVEIPQWPKSAGRDEV